MKIDERMLKKFEKATVTCHHCGWTGELSVCSKTPMRKTITEPYVTIYGFCYYCPPCGTVLKEEYMSAENAKPPRRQS